MKLVVVFLSYLMVSCGGGSSPEATPMPSSTPTPTPSPSPSQTANPSPIYELSMNLERIDSGVLNPFKVSVEISSGGTPATNMSTELAVSINKGAMDTLTEASPGLYEFTVTPEATGEHSVSVEIIDTEYGVTKTAIVLAGVHSDWGQPMAVPGLVNTEGYEDGVTVTADGEYLFVQYGPIYFSGFFLFQAERVNGGCGGDRLTPSRCSHPWIDNTVGPITAPERPDFFDGRIRNGQWRHNAVSWGLSDEQAPNFATSTMFYGFEHLGNGVYGNPFYLAFSDEGDGLINPYGLSVATLSGGSYQAAFTLNDPADQDMVDFDNNGFDDAESFFDVFTLSLGQSLGSNIVLGSYTPSGVVGTPPVRGSDFPSTLVDFGKVGIEGIAGTQGNAHLYTDNGAISSIWTDDEYDEGGDRDDLSVYVLTSGAFPDGSWQKLVLPGVINEPGANREFQPFFTGNELFYAKASDSFNPVIYKSSYSGASNLSGYANSDNWAAPEVVLNAGDEIDVGSISAVGEPNIAEREGEEYLYFVYAKIRGYDSESGFADIDMQVGYVKKR